MPWGSHRDIFRRLCSLEHLLAAARITVRGKRRRPDVQRFLARRESTVARLADDLGAGRWRAGGFDLLQIRDPKPRIIARAHLLDRIVHTALVGCIEPVFARSLMPEDFACRRGYGPHRAVLALRRQMQRHRFALHLDVRAFFPSIDVELLRRLVADRIDDPPFMGVLDRVFAAGRGLYGDPGLRRFAGLTDDWPPPGRGLPIGAATSQFLATHVYLLAFDHHVKRALKVPGYLRFVDDLFVFGDRRADLRRWRAAIGQWLADERELRLKHPHARVLACAGHLDALGYRITRRGQAALPRAPRRLRRRAEAFVEGRGDVDIARSMAGAAGVLLF